MSVTALRTPSRATYDKHGSIDARIAYSVGARAPSVMVALKREALRARRAEIALCVLVMRVRLMEGASRLSRLAELSSLKMRVADTLRRTDTVGQLHDGEVVAVLPGAELAGAEKAAERLVAANHRRSQAKLVEFTIGAARLGDDEGDLDALIERARRNVLALAAPAS